MTDPIHVHDGGVFDPSMPNQEDKAVLVKVDQICDRFERALLSGEEARIEDYVSEIGAASRAILFGELLHSELEVSSRLGRVVSIADYERRFPDLGGVIEQVFSAAGETLVHRQGATSVVDGPSRQQTEPVTREPPEQLGRYRLIRLLGRGGMATVYLAHDGKLDRRVALKIPHFNVHVDTEMIARFSREARTMAAISHPNLCTVHDVAEIDGFHCLIMEWIDGESLADVLRRETQIPSIQAATWMRSLASALQVAHDAGVIHRDLKPSNILIRQDGDPVITDFGLARRLPHVAEQEAEPLTGATGLLGTPHYMSPEQVDGDPSDLGPTSDVYSLGVVLYQMLCGRRPFEGSVASVLAQIVAHNPEPPSARNPRVPPALEAICLHAMAQRAEDRYPSGDVFADALTDFLEQSPATSDDASRSDVQTKAILAASVVTAGAGAKRSASGIGARLGKLAALVFAGLALLAALLVYRITTPRGEIVVHAAEGTNLTISVRRNGEEVAVLDTENNWSITRKAGTYELAVKGEDYGLTLSQGIATVTRNGRVEVTVLSRRGNQAKESAPVIETGHESDISFRDSGQRLGDSDSLDVALGDLDGDGDLDAYVANQQVKAADQIWINDGRGFFTRSEQTLEKFDSRAVALGDLDGDQDLDAFVAGDYQDASRVLLNDGTGMFVDSGQRLGSGQTKDVALGDFDGDDDLDAVVVSTSHGHRVGIWTNGGSGDFGANSRLAHDHKAWAVSVGDLDGDGDLDLAFGNWTGARLTVLSNDGVGRFGELHLPVNYRPWDVGIHDLDSDGKLDAYAVAGGLPTFLNDDAGNFAARQQPLGRGLHRVAVGDLDGDTHLDLLAFFKGTEPNAIWRNDGTGNFSRIGELDQLFSNGAALGDLDGDGDWDAFVVNASGEPNRVWLNETKPLAGGENQRSE